jgi:hypothetical protein
VRAWASDVYHLPASASSAHHLQQSPQLPVHVPCWVFSLARHLPRYLFLVTTLRLMSIECTIESSSPLCPQPASSSLRNLNTRIGVGVGVGVASVLVALAFLLRRFRRAQRRHVLEQGVLTEQLMATERERQELELEGENLFCRCLDT